MHTLDLISALFNPYTDRVIALDCVVGVSLSCTNNHYNDIPPLCYNNFLNFCFNVGGYLLLFREVLTLGCGHLQVFLDTSRPAANVFALCKHEYDK